MAIKHYICTSCSEESSKPALCPNENCARFNQPMTQCYCDDGLHDPGDQESAPEPVSEDGSEPVEL